MKAVLDPKIWRVFFYIFAMEQQLTHNHTKLNIKSLAQEPVFIIVKCEKRGEENKINIKRIFKELSFKDLSIKQQQR